MTTTDFKPITAPSVNPGAYKVDRALAACRRIAKLLDLPKGADFSDLVSAVEQLVKDDDVSHDESTAGHSAKRGKKAK